ncbi:MAG: hypothetical protein ACRECF_09075, partial [Methyloceanibacter sp.]
VDGEEVDGEEVNRPSQNRKEEEINLQRRGARPRAFFIPLKNQIVIQLSGTLTGVCVTASGAPLSPPNIVSSANSISLTHVASRDDASLPTRSDVRRALVSMPDVDDAMRAVACTIASVRTDSAVRSTAQGRSHPDRR